MKIKINDTNRESITAALASANGKATAHTFLHAAEIMAAARDAEAQLVALGINKGDRAGVTALSRSGGSVPHAYKYSRTVTRATLVRGRADWFLTEVAAFETLDKKQGETRITLNAEQAVAVTEKFSARFSVKLAR